MYYSDRETVISPRTRENIDIEIRKYVYVYSVSLDRNADVIQPFGRLLQAGEDRVTALLKDKEDELHRVSDWASGV